MKILIIDVLGTPYNVYTSYIEGLGGSESAVAKMFTALTKLGHTVEVINNFKPHSNLEASVHDTPLHPAGWLTNSRDFTTTDYDVVISSRSCIPFTEILQVSPKPWMDKEIVGHIYRSLKSAKKRILWMHDTFCDGDLFIEELVTNKVIDHIYTLSDWHTSYILNCDHGMRRNFEVLQKSIYQTRNGVDSLPVTGGPTLEQKIQAVQNQEVNFVYNASVTKGLLPLLEDIWPRISAKFPKARLDIIGGYYNMKEPDAQELKFNELYAKYEDDESIEFHGVVPISEVYDILRRAHFMLYPAAFPETFGISTLESIVNNTPVITCNFGALSKLAPDRCSYKLDYAIEPNSLFPHIQRDYQITKFIELVETAVLNTYLYRQKLYATEYYREKIDSLTWDAVALEWVNHWNYTNNNPLTDIEKTRRVILDWAELFDMNWVNKSDRILGNFPNA